MTTTNKHWTELLPEAGTISKAGQSQFFLIERMNKLHEEKMLLNKQYNEEEERLNKLALTQWTKEEIAEAKENAKLQNA